MGRSLRRGRLQNLPDPREADYFFSVFRVPFFSLFWGTSFSGKTVPGGFPLGVMLDLLFVFLGVLFGVFIFASIFELFLEPSGEEKAWFSMEGLSKFDFRPSRKRWPK